MPLGFGVPEDIRVIMKSLPGVAVRSISYPKLLSSLKTVAKNYVKSNIPDDLKKNLKECRPKSIEIEFDKHEKLSGVKSSESAQQVLELYFSQLQQSEGLFLDLRERHFDEAENLRFFPSPLWYQFSEGFIANLRGLYKGFYEGDEDLFINSLKELGLAKGCAEEEVQELKQLFYHHFGENPESVRFSFEHFRSSFSAIFEFLNDKKIKIPIEFVYLGIYLATLYLNLDSINQSLNPKKAYFNSIPS